MGHELKSNMIIMIGGAPYRVLPIRDGENNGFDRGYAYHIKTQLDDRVYPYRGVVKTFNKLSPKAEPGIYVSKESGKYMVIYPKKKDSSIYDPDNIRDFNDDSLYKEISFIPTDIDLSVDGDIFNPPIRADDDIMNKIVKYCIKKKGIVFDAYKARFDSIGSSGKANGANSNNKNNAKRALLENKSLSSNKAKEYGDVLEYDIAIAICDKADATKKMNTKGRPIIIYSGEPFDLSDPIDISEELSGDLREESEIRTNFGDLFE